MHGFYCARQNKARKTRELWQKLTSSKAHTSISSTFSKNIACFAKEFALCPKNKDSWMPLLQQNDTQRHAFARNDETRDRFSPHVSVPWAPRVTRAPPLPHQEEGGTWAASGMRKLPGRRASPHRFARGARTAVVAPLRRFKNYINQELHRFSLLWTTLHCKRRALSIACKVVGSCTLNISRCKHCRWRALSIARRCSAHGAPEAPPERFGQTSLHCSPCIHQPSSCMASSASLSVSSVFSSNISRKRVSMPAGGPLSMISFTFSSSPMERS